MKLRLLPVVAIAAARKPRASAGVRRTPTRDRPLLFFHLPKTGGSSLRHVILQTFPRAVSLVPGSGGLPSEATERVLANDQWRDRAACATVAAGHFKPGPLLKTLAEIGGSAGCGAPRRWAWASREKPPVDALDDVDCVIASRDPVARMVSHYLHFHRRSSGGRNRTVSQFARDEGASQFHVAAGGLVVEHWLSYGLFWGNFSRASDVALAVLRRCKAVFPDAPGGEAAAWLAGAKRAPRFVDVSRRNVNRRDAAADRALSPSQLDAVLALPAVRREGAIWHALRRDHGLDACSGFGCWRADGTGDRGRRPPS